MVVAVVGGVETDAAFVFVRSEQNSCTLGVVVVATNYFAVVVGQSVCLRLNGGVFAGCCFDVGDEVVLSRETGYVERKTVYLFVVKVDRRSYEPVVSCSTRGVVVPPPCGEVVVGIKEPYVAATAMPMVLRLPTCRCWRQ